MVRKSTRVRRSAGFAALALGATTVFAGCADSRAGDSSGGSDAAASLGDCGTVPVRAPGDPDGFLANLPDEVRASYNGYALDVTESPWKEFAPKGPGPYDVAIVYSQTVVPYQATLLDSVKNALEDSDDIANVSVSLYEQDPALAVRNFQTAINEDPDIILAQPLGADAVAPLIEEAAEKGIPTITMQVNVDTPSAVNVTPNPYLLGAIPTAEVVKTMGGRGTLLGVRGIQGVPIETQTFEGIDAAVALCPDIDFDDSVVGGYNPATAKSEVSKWLSTHPGEVGGVVHAAIMGPGILSAFEQVGRPVPPIADVAATKGVLAYMKANPEYEAVGSAQGAASIGTAIADAALRMLHGDGPEVSSIVLPTPLISRDNVDDYQFGEDTSSAASVEPPVGTYPPEGFMDAVFGTE